MGSMSVQVQIYQYIPNLQASLHSLPLSKTLRDIFFTCFQQQISVTAVANHRFTMIPSITFYQKYPNYRPRQSRIEFAEKLTSDHRSLHDIIKQSFSCSLLRQFLKISLDLFEKFWKTYSCPDKFWISAASLKVVMFYDNNISVSCFFLEVEKPTHTPLSHQLTFSVH